MTGCLRPGAARRPLVRQTFLDRPPVKFSKSDEFAPQHAFEDWAARAPCRRLLTAAHRAWRLQPSVGDRPSTSLISCAALGTAAIAAIMASAEQEAHGVSL